MPDPSFVSTFNAIAIIPVAILFLYALWSGLKGDSRHKLVGLIGILWDLSLSIGYLVFRALGGQVGDVDLSGGTLAYFIIHGTMAIIVIGLELVILFLGYSKWKKRSIGKYHRKMAIALFILWWGAFLSGEIFYVVYYLL